LDLVKIMRTRFRKIVTRLDVTASEEEQLHQGNVDDRQRCQARLGISEPAMNKMITDFLAARGSATVCPPAYAVLSRQYGV
jgi:hypothetical protein